MRLSYNKTIVIIGMAALLVISFTQCADYEYRSAACDDCLTTEPTEGELLLNFQITDKQIAIQYNVYEGNIETGKLLFSDTTTINRISYLLPTKRNYSAEAFYEVDGKIVVVVDGGEMKTKKILCTDPADSENTIKCWYVPPARLNLGLEN